MVLSNIFRLIFCVYKLHEFIIFLHDIHDKQTCSIDHFETARASTAAGRGTAWAGCDNVAGVYCQQQRSPSPSHYSLCATLPGCTSPSQRMDAMDVDAPLRISSRRAALGDAGRLNFAASIPNPNMARKGRRTAGSGGAPCAGPAGHINPARVAPFVGELCDSVIGHSISI